VEPNEKQLENLKHLQAEREIKQLRQKQDLAKLRDADARVLDLQTPAPKFNPDDEKAQYLGELQEIAKPKDPAPDVLCSSLNAVIPAVPGELILIAAHSGKGKSTVVANICYTLWKQGRKALVFSNEEPKKDVYHRVGCIEHRIPLGKVKDQVLTRQELMMLAESSESIIDNVHVIDQSYRGKSEFVKTIDGFKYVWKSIDFSQYSAVIIDYYQNVTQDSRVPSKNAWEVQSELADFLDAQKNVIGIPIFILAQLKLFTDDEKEFEERLKGRKIIFDKCTFAIELASNKGDFTAEWKIHKDRSHGRDGRIVKTGFDKASSQFVDLSNNFRDKQAEWIRQRQMEQPAFVDKSGTNP
jgi:replicative DNA helicase